MPEDRSAAPGDNSDDAEEHTTFGRHETVEERADRRWGDMLQEVRVAQTGVQILLGFLLSVAFTTRFASLERFDKDLYVATVILGAVSAGALIAPVSLHRFLAGHGLKPQLVLFGSRLISCGVALLGLTMGAALLLLLHVATNSDIAYVITGVVMIWFGLCWLLLPVVLLRRARRSR